MRKREGFRGSHRKACSPPADHCCCVATGMRQGEILGLKWEHVDFDRKTIFIAHTKTGRPRRIPMSKPVEVELRSLKQDSEANEHVFSYARTGLKLTTFRHTWEERVNKHESRDLDFTIYVTRSQCV
jgi:integrase